MRLSIATSYDIATTFTHSLTHSQTVPRQKLPQHLLLLPCLPQVDTTSKSLQLTKFLWVQDFRRNTGNWGAWRWSLLFDLLQAKVEKTEHEHHIEDMSFLPSIWRISDCCPVHCCCPAYGIYPIVAQVSGWQLQTSWSWKHHNNLGQVLKDLRQNIWIISAKRVRICKLLTSYEFDCFHIEPNAGWPRPGDKDCCPRCRGRVFQAERVLAAKGVYHRLGKKKAKRKREEKEKREE